jgi:hypothetical protein
MSIKMSSAALGAALLLFVSVEKADAGLVSYSDFASWSAAVAGYTSLAIPEPVPNIPDPVTNVIIPGAQYFESGMVTYGGVSFATSAALSNGNFFNIGPAFFGSNGTSPVLSSQAQTFGEANILITLAAPVKAFALNFDTFDGNDVSFKLSSGDTLTLDSPGNAYDLTGFFGVVDDAPFKTILLTSSDRVLNLNELNFGAAVSPIPEPATWVMLLFGFIGMGVLGSRLPLRTASAWTGQDTRQA